MKLYVLFTAYVSAIHFLGTELISFKTNSILSLLTLLVKQKVYIYMYHMVLIIKKISKGDSIQVY